MKSADYYIARGDTGLALPFCAVTVYQSDGTTIATIYATDGVTVIGNPMTADSNGKVTLTAPDATYVLKAVAAGGTYTSPGFKIDHFDFFAFKASALVAGSLITRGFTQTTARLIGRTTAATGAVEEISIGAGLTFAAGSLAVALDTDGALTANSNALIAPQQAVKTYIDNAVNGLKWKNPAGAATTAALPANAYANGTAGVGATLTATANAALSAQDGVTLIAGDSLLVKNEAAGANNGLYTVTQVGSGVLPYILTRRTDADQSTELVNATCYVSAGTIAADTQWTCSTNAPITVGTTGLTFVQSNAGTGVTSVALSLPAIFTVTGSPVTTTGTLTATLASQAANLLFASPNGSSGNPTFRALVAADLPMATTAEVRAGTVTKPVGVDTLAAAQALQTLTDGATITWDLSIGFNAKVTIAAVGRTLAVTNPKEGYWYTLLIYQDATGSRTITTYPASFNWGTAGAPTLTTTASKHDVISLFCTNASTPTYDAFLGGKGF